jgi:hypothetical protein
MHRRRVGPPLLQALVRPRGVEAGDVLAQDAAQVRLAQDQDMVEALAPDTPREALAGGVLPGGAVGRARPLDAGRRGDAREGQAILAVAVADEVARRWSNGVASRRCRATQASVGWRVTPT